MKTFIKILFVGLVMMNVAACSSPITQTNTIDLPTINPNLPQPTNLQPVEWKVYTSTDLKQLVSKNTDVVLFTLTPEQNQKLNNNIVEMQRYILQLKQTVIYYQNQNSNN